MKTIILLLNINIFWYNVVTCNDYCTYEGSEHATSLLKYEIYTFNDVCQQILINQIVMNFIAYEFRVIQ